MTSDEGIRSRVSLLLWWDVSDGVPENLSDLPSRKETQVSVTTTVSLRTRVRAGEVEKMPENPFWSPEGSTDKE